MAEEERHCRVQKQRPSLLFTHRPLFDLKPDWEWFTSDGDEVMNILAPYQNVTVLYGHIHRGTITPKATCVISPRARSSSRFPILSKRRTKAHRLRQRNIPFRNLGGRLIQGRQRARCRLFHANG